MAILYNAEPFHIIARNSYLLL